MRRRKNKYLAVGDIVNTKWGEQGIIVEIIDDVWVKMMGCDGHVEETSVNSVWSADSKINGLAELNAFFLKIFGYSSLYDEENDVADTQEPLDNGMEALRKDMLRFIVNKGGEAKLSYGEHEC